MPSYDSLMQITDLAALTDEALLQSIGQLVDAAERVGKLEGATKALEWCDELEKRDLTSLQLATLDYFRANAWGDLQVARHADHGARWEWEQTETKNQTFFLRRALNSPAFDSLAEMRRTQILTNLANQLNTAGRFVEALEYWTRALDIIPHFWMAQGNRGQAYISYGQALYDGGHQGAFLVSADDDLTSALASHALQPALGSSQAYGHFKNIHDWLHSAIDVEAVRKSVELHDHPLGDTSDERTYRIWCLRHRLFLNPLNDLGPIAIAARDVFTLPNFSAPLDEPPVLIGLFNQMKQEYVSARWLHYDAVNTGEPHFSDRGVLLHNTLDYPSYSLAVEKLKLSYRAAYSIFDKIAFFLNEYMRLGMKPKDVSFTKVWREKTDGPVRPEFETCENWPFRGLYWLSKDVVDKDFQGTTEPDARALQDIRNHLEHRYLKIHEFMIPPPPPSDTAFSLFTDTLAYSISRTDFETKGLRVLMLARAALIYLSLGMHREEQRRDAEKPEALIAPMQLDVWEDEWKV